MIIGIINEHYISTICCCKCEKYFESDAFESGLEAETYDFPAHYTTRCPYCGNNTIVALSSKTAENLTLKEENIWYKILFVDK